MFKVLVVIGTRPEAIKMAPIILELKKRRGIKCKILITGQHRELADQMLKFFKIKPDYDLEVMKKNQTLGSLTARILDRIEDVLEKEKPNLILVEGDTTTVFVAALAGFYHGIKVGHVEAGLRSFDKYQPYPEEINRRLTSVLADIHFAPTPLSKKNLIREGVSAKEIIVTGNSVIDALLMATKMKLKYHHPVLKKIDFKAKKVILLTAHRRENFDQGLANICLAIKTIIKNNQDIEIVYPVHPNPKVAEPVQKMLGKNKQVHLIEPLDYEEFVKLMNDCYLILTDSGGVQEEAPTLGKPILILRNTTERPEGINAGTSKLVGTNPQKIIRTSQKLLIDKKEYLKIARKKNPYGDGKTAKRIVAEIIKRQKIWAK